MKKVSIALVLFGLGITAPLRATDCKLTLVKGSQLVIQLENAIGEKVFQAPEALYFPRWNPDGDRVAAATGMKNDRAEVLVVSENGRLLRKFQITAGNKDVSINGVLGLNWAGDRIGVLGHIHPNAAEYRIYSTDGTIYRSMLVGNLHSSSPKGTRFLHTVWHPMGIPKERQDCNLYLDGKRLLDLDCGARPIGKASWCGEDRVALLKRQGNRTELIVFDVSRNSKSILVVPSEFQDLDVIWLSTSKLMVFGIGFDRAFTFDLNESSPAEIRLGELTKLQADFLECLERSTRYPSGHADFWTPALSCVSLERGSAK